VIDDAGFHSTKNIEVPQNIVLLRIPPNNPELNPYEHVWQYIKNQRFKSMKNLKEWLSEMLCDMKPETITSITGNQHFLKTFNN
jgi:transposase